MNVLVLMAGADDAFRTAGFPYPKNLTEIAGLPLFQRVVEGLGSLRRFDAQFLFAIKEDEDLEFHTGHSLQLMEPKSSIVRVPSNTMGAACTALLAIEHINNDKELVVVNGDTIVETALDQVIGTFRGAQLDGGMIVFEALHPRWSFVRCDEKGLVIEAAEKIPISRLATTGFYYFRTGGSFVDSAMAMIRKNDSTQGKFYICPAYNQMILKQKKIGTYLIEKDKYVSLATPQGAQLYEEFLNKSRRSN